MTSFFATLCASIRAVPIISGWVTSFVDFYTRQSIEKIDTDHVQRCDKVRVILEKIKESDSHAEKAVLLAALGDVERGL